MSAAALFDMDRTVLRIDSSMSWMRWQRRRGSLSAGFAARAMVWAAMYELALLDIDAVADRVVRDLRGDLEAEMLAEAAAWYEQEVAEEITSEARAAVAEHRARGDVVALLTGGAPHAARAVAGALDVEHVLCTELEVRDGRFTGFLAQRCFGRHKVTVAERWARDHGVDLGGATFYSDSYNDLPMLSRVGSPIAVNPDRRLRRHAERLGWPIHRWG